MNFCLAPGSSCPSQIPQSAVCFLGNRLLIVGFFKRQRSLSSGNQEPVPDPDGTERQPPSELWGPWEQGSGQESRFVSGMQFKKPVGFDTPTEKLSRPAIDAAPGILVDPQATYREHVSGSLASHPSEGPLFQPAYLPYPPYPGYQPQVYSPQGHSFPPPAPNYAPFG